LYPDVQERSVESKIGFYPKLATKDSQQLFLLGIGENCLEFYGLDGLEDIDFRPWLRFGVEFDAESGKVIVPDNLEEMQYRKLLQFIMGYNFRRHGVELMHSPSDFSEGTRSKR
jgi:hypothetical protein